MKEKYLEYYMDSRIYTKEDIKKTIENTKKDFYGKKFEVNVFLNRFGIYEIVFEFKTNESMFTKIRLWFRQNRQKMLSESSYGSQKKQKSRLEKYYGNTYGKYKETKEYKPY